MSQIGKWCMHASLEISKLFGRSDWERTSTTDVHLRTAQSHSEMPLIQKYHSRNQRARTTRGLVISRPLLEVTRVQSRNMIPHYSWLWIRRSLDSFGLLASSNYSQVRSFYRFSDGVKTFVIDVTTAVTPLVTRQLLEFLTLSYYHVRYPEYIATFPPVGRGIGIAIGIFAMQSTTSILTQHSFQKSMTVGMLAQSGVRRFIFLELPGNDTCNCVDHGDDISQSTAAQQQGTFWAFTRKDHHFDQLWWP